MQRFIWLLLLFVSCSLSDPCGDFSLKGAKMAERSKGRGTSMYFPVKSSIERTGNTLTVIFYKLNGEHEEKRFHIDSVNCSDPDLTLLYYHEKVSPLSGGSPSCETSVDWPIAIAIDRIKKEVVIDYFAKGFSSAGIIPFEE